MTAIELADYVSRFKAYPVFSPKDEKHCSGVGVVCQHFMDGLLVTNEGWAAFKSSPYGQVSAIGNHVHVREDQEGGSSRKCC